MHDLPLLAILGFLLLGFISGFIAYPRIVYWAKQVLNEFHGGKCAHCGREALVTACHRCRKDVAFCHYFAILGTDVPNRESVMGRRSAQICTECLSVTERSMLEDMLRQ
jgi:hypothetical protein